MPNKPTDILSRQSRSLLNGTSKDYSGLNRLAQDYLNNLKQIQDDYLTSRQDFLSGFSVSNAIGNLSSNNQTGSASATDTSDTDTQNSGYRIDTDVMDAAAAKIKAKKAATVTVTKYEPSSPDQPDGYDLAYYQSVEQQALDTMNQAKEALSLAQSIQEQTPSPTFSIGKYGKLYAEEYARVSSDLTAAQQKYAQAQSAYAQAKADREAFEAATLGTVNGLAISTDRSISDIEADLNAAGTYVEDLDQWLAKPGQQDTLNNLLYERNLAWVRDTWKEGENKEYTKGDQVEAATLASVGEGLDSWSTDTQVMMYKLFGLDVPDYLLVDSPLAIKNQMTLENASGVLKTISGVSNFAGYIIPSLVTDMLMPASVATQLGKVGKILYRVLRNAPNATAAGGSSYRQAKAEGKSDEEASAYSLLNTAANLAYGMFFEELGMKEGNTAGQNAAITKVKKGIDKAVSKVIKNPNTVKTIAALSKNMGEAAAQTFLQEAIDPMLRNATLGEANTLGDIWNHAMSRDTMDMVLNSALIAGAMSFGGSGKKKNGSADVEGEGGLLNEANLKRLSDAELHEVGDAITNAYAETVKADPNMHVTDAQIEAYKNQSKKNMGSRENAISEILVKGDELKSSFSSKIEEAKGKAKAAGIEVDETPSNKALQGEVPNQTIEAETQTQQDSAELLKGEEDGGRIETEKPNFKTNQEVFSDIQRIEVFRDQEAVEHILLGQINSKNKAVGFHYEGMPEPRGKIIEGTKSAPDEHGIYSGKVEVGGVAKKLNNGESSFFPKEWTPQQVVDAINEAYQSKVRYTDRKNVYSGKTNDGITIVIALDENGKIKMAYPIYSEGDK